MTVRSISSASSELNKICFTTPVLHLCLGEIALFAGSFGASSPNLNAVLLADSFDARDWVAGSRFSILKIAGVI